MFDGEGRALVRGLDRTIVIDPRRLHLTLGVMALDGETKTVADALGLLESLQPRLRAILEERKTAKVKLETLDVLKTEKRDGEVNAHVLYLGVKEADEDTARLQQICGRRSTLTQNMTRADRNRRGASGIQNGRIYYRNPAAQGTHVLGHNTDRY